MEIKKGCWVKLTSFFTGKILLIEDIKLMEVWEMENFLKIISF